MTTYRTQPYCKLEMRTIDFEHLISTMKAVEQKVTIKTWKMIDETMPGDKTPQFFRMELRE